MESKQHKRAPSQQATRLAPVYSASFDVFADKVREADLDCLLAGPSHAPWEVGQCTINSTVLQYGVEGGSKIVHGISRSDALIFIVPHTKFSDRVIFDGEEVQPYDFAALPPSSYFSASTFGPHRWMSISLPLGLLAEVAAQVGRNDLKWIEREKCLISTSAKLVECLAAEAANIVALSSRGALLGNHNHNGDIERPLLNALIAAIAGANNKTSLSDETAKSSRKIMNKALEYVRHRQWQALHVSDLALAADVTERTLGRSFDQQLGVGPSRYLKLRRLNVVRRALRGKLGKPTKVAAIMRAYGVSEFGRFAGEYKALFGESPSETRQRYAQS